jgi:hypothetical protein
MIAALGFTDILYAQEKTSSPLNEVITTYLDLKNALVKDQADSARMAAKALADAIDKVPMGELNPRAHGVWMQYYEKMGYDAEHIKSTSDISHQREHFITLSTTMYKLLKEANGNTFKLYYQFCPMANDGKGAYWVSEQSGIANPYFGKKMLSCGSTKDSLNAVQ